MSTRLEELTSEFLFSFVENYNTFGIEDAKEEEEKEEKIETKSFLAPTEKV